MLGGGRGSKTPELSQSEKMLYSTSESKRFRANQFLKQILNFVQGCILNLRGKMSHS